MPNKGRLPPSLLTGWTNWKKNLVANVERIVGDDIDPEDKKKFKKGLEGLFKTFNAGLGKQLAKASNANDDAEAKKALGKVILICAKYRKNTREAVVDILADVNPNLDKITKDAVAKSFGRIIKEKFTIIEKAAAATLLAMP